MNTPMATNLPEFATTSATSAHVGTAVGRELTPVTYYPVSMQRQFFANQAAIRPKPYAKFFHPDLTVPAAWAQALQQGPLPPEQTFSPSAADINQILDPSRRFPDAGYVLLEGPCAYSQSRIEMPGVTTDMFKWWFLWHPVEKERYSLWFPHAHIDNYVVDPARLANPALSYEERLYGKLLLGHMGETLPYLLWRLDARAGAFGGDGGIKPAELIRRNVASTTAGMFSDPPLACALQGLGEDLALYSVDHPFEGMTAANEWFEQAPVTPKVREKIAWRNAARLLKL